MPQAAIDRLIINPPYQEPRRHWLYDREMRLFDLVEARRALGRATGGSGEGWWGGPIETAR